MNIRSNVVKLFMNSICLSVNANSNSQYNQNAKLSLNSVYNLKKREIDHKHSYWYYFVIPLTILLNYTSNQTFHQIRQINIIYSLNNDTIN